jgi:hypothetical protein
MAGRDANVARRERVAIRNASIMFDLPDSKGWLRIHIFRGVGAPPALAQKIKGEHRHCDLQTLAMGAQGW